MASDRALMIDEIIAIADSRPHLLRPGRSRKEFFKSKGWEMDEAEGLLSAIERDLPHIWAKISTLTPSPERPSSSHSPDGSRGLKRLFDSSPCEPGNMEDFAAANKKRRDQNRLQYGLQTPAASTSIVRGTTPSQASDVTYSNIASQPGISKKLARPLFVMAQLALRSFPPSFQDNQSSQWQSDKLDPVALLKNFQTAFKAHKNYVMEPPISEDLRELQKEIDDLHVAKSQADVKVEELQKEIVQHKATLNLTQEKTTSLEQRLINAHSTTASLTDSLSVAQKSLALLQTTVDQHRIVDDQAAVQLRLLQKERDDFELRSKIQQEENMAHNQTISGLKAEIQVLVQARAVSQQALEQFRLEAEDDKAESAAANDNLREAVRTELLTSDETRLHFRNIFVREQKEEEDRAIEQKKTSRSAAARRGWHTRKCTDQECQLPACIQRRQRLRASGISLRGTEAQRLVSLLDGSSWQ